MAGRLAAAGRRLSLTAELVAFPHTLFALPFSFMAMLMGARGAPALRQVLWITAAMVGARTAAMSFNRIADLRFDRDNPRTSGRPLPSGRLGVPWAVGLVLLSVGLFVLACRQLGPLCLALSPVALLIVLGYSYTKRFTWTTHLFLGLGLAVAPVGAWIAVQGPLSPTPALLAAAVLCWTAGFDLIYACQDVAYDRAHGLHSIPARFGVTAALRASRLLHVVMVLCLALAASHERLGAIFLGGLALAAAALIYEHLIVRPHDLSRVNTAFFTLNGWVSITLLLATLLDLKL